MKDNAISTDHTHVHDQSYLDFVVALNERLCGADLKSSNITGYLLATDIDVWGSYLDEIENMMGVEARQEYTCAKCRHVVERLGRIVMTHPTATGASFLFWQPDVDDSPMAEVFTQMHHNLREVLNTDPKVLGLEPYVWQNMTPWQQEELESVERGGFNHLHCTLPLDWLKTNFDAEKVNKTLETLATNYRVGFYRNNAEWLRVALKQLDGKNRLAPRVTDTIKTHLAFYDEHVNLDKEGINHLPVVRKATVVRAIAGASHGNPLKLNDTTLGNLIEGLQTNPEKAVRIYKSETNPESYRQGTATNATAVANDEKFILENGYQDSLRMRYATFTEICDDLSPLWTASKPEPKEESLFAGVKKKVGGESVTETSPLKATPTRISFTAFMDGILPDFQTLRVKSIFTPGRHKENVGACITTMVNREAKPILKWHTEDMDIPYAWLYFLNTPMSHIIGGTRDVGVVINDPSTQAGLSRYTSVFFIVPLETPCSINTPNPLFPEIIKDELYQCRKSIANYNQLAENAVTDRLDHVVYGFNEGAFQDPEFQPVFEGTNSVGELVSYHIVMW